MLCYNTPMLKTASAAIAAMAIAAPAAIAGPYVVVENNAGWYGSDFGGSTTDLHIGYEGGNKVAGYYIEAGPSYYQGNNADGETFLSGKLGGSVAVADGLSIYGELSAGFDDVNSYGSKIGAKYSF
jgi:hypothetical protein